MDTSTPDDVEQAVPEPMTEPEFDVVAALMRLEMADAGIRSRLRDRLHLNATDLAAVQYLARADAAGRTVYSKDLAAVLGVSAPAVTAVVNRLIRAGHLVRTTDPERPRFRLLTLTDETKALLTDIIGDTQVLLQTVVAKMSNRDKKRAVALITELARALDDGAHPRPGLLDGASAAEREAAPEG
ncbi:MarR family winged helix-turn-helix transcriptional regulator [Curtobacterium sp. ISL-83]|uniref:MarR family winged helix-turn-helix transcriptional regulator n=1 Tax=Curtobacterium sp. ISL-83 TaxID=2819145 RepID=UPI001BE615CE|nr:MarR family transcriptional regulator [Curtobacterium sp. ISL-83]MBT2502205.1 MarR family transcriptional regulator [Curtobacterium sp. ISL-83]